MRKSSHLTQLADYRPFPFCLDAVQLFFALDDECTQVTGKLQFSLLADKPQELKLNGEELELLSIQLDEYVLQQSDYQLDQHHLTIPASLLENKTTFQLEISVAIRPSKNFALEGLYKSSSMLCTQCEAEGFRRIIYYPDRPDVMSRFQVTISGDAKRYPVMLSNGNQISESKKNGVKTVTWEDPFHKPCYLFALVAGQLERVTNHFTTASGRKVALHMYVEEHNLNKCHHALRSLKKAMRWDEQAYGREYDLDLFQIVATDDFNSGAMENKGLNIFNSECVLAHPETTTDDDYLTIEAIVAHEYFHNWSGNRVTLRDWFQLSLKEGFTVFRENQFVAYMHSEKATRVQEASLICTAQFAEDSSPLRHPVRPSSYQQIRNFYTLTVYEKGAEVIRMLHTLAGESAFRAGAERYFDKHDGQAVCVEDFVACISEASGINLSRFMHWYTQAGTPRVDVEIAHDPHKQCCHLTINQHIANEPDAPPMHIPIDTALYDNHGRMLGTPKLLELTQRTQRFTFSDIAELPTPSLLRGFSAPVDLHFRYDEAQLYLLLEHESDGYIRWKSAQSIKSRALLAGIDCWPNPNHESTTNLERVYQLLLKQTLANPSNDNDDKALLCLLFSIPSFNYLAEQQQRISVSATWNSRHYAIAKLGEKYSDDWRAIAEREQPGKHFNTKFDQIVKRRLHLQALTFLEAGSDKLNASTWNRYLSASNMTQREQALETLIWHRDSSYREQALDHLLEKAHQDTTLAGRWFEFQACIPSPETCQVVASLTKHKLFDWHNPNKVRSLIGFFANRNPIAFHTPEGYAFFTESILHVDSYNPQVASRLATPLYRWRRFEPELANQLHQQLLHLDKSNISTDLREGVQKSLQHA